MIKKFMTVLSISMLIFNSLKIEVYSDGKYNRKLIKGNTEQISMELNESVFKSADEAILINENAIIDGIAATPLAYVKNAPIIPIKSKGMDKEIEKYLDELGIEKITIVGSSESVSQVTANNLKRLGYEVSRIYGENRYKTSIEIAKELNKIKKVNSIILINSSIGVENALGIYSFAAQENMPIIWVDGENFQDIKSYISKNKIEKVYAIGDSNQFKYKLNENIKNIEFIEEINKSQTNLNIIENFKENKTNKVYTISVEFGNNFNTNKYISLGVVAAKQNIPILICNETLTKLQEDYLDKNNIDTLEQVGTNIDDYSIYNTLTNKSFLYSIALILVLIIMLIRIFRYKL